MQLFFKYILLYVGIGLLLGGLLSCKDDEDDGVGSILLTANITLSSELNPSGYAPLSALLNVQVDTTASLEIIVKGRQGSRSDLAISTLDFERDHSIDLHGLYGGHDNLIEIYAKDEAGNTIGFEEYSILTDSLIGDLPEVVMQHESLPEDHPVFYLVNYFGYEFTPVPQRPFLVDQFGDIRWFLDFSSNEELRSIIMDNGIFHMQNNDIVFSCNGRDVVYITDLFGNIKQRIALGDYTFHHSVVEKQDGNLLLTANEKGQPTVEDIILELDPRTASVVHVWNLRESLDQNRTLLAFNDRDWIHVNGLVYDDRDNTIIISGRYQGLTKLNYDNEVQWILAPHKDWAEAGNGIDLNPLLLQPLDQNGNAINNQDLIEGNLSVSDFDWNWLQHSPIILPNGNYMCFDNGLNRHYGSSPLFSRAVEYKIDEANRTVQQIWEYGKELGLEGYSRSVSKVNFVESVNHVSFTPGAIAEAGTPHGRIIEVDKATKQLKLDLRVAAPQSLSTITFHNAQRFEFK